MDACVVYIMEACTGREGNIYELVDAHPFYQKQKNKLQRYS